MDDARERFRQILDRLNVAEYARSIDRPYRTVQDWRRGTHAPPPEALREMVDFLRTRSRAYADEADALERLADDGEAEG